MLLANCVRENFTFLERVEIVLPCLVSMPSITPSKDTSSHRVFAKNGSKLGLFSFFLQAIKVPVNIKDTLNKFVFITHCLYIGQN
jgi:hypothetical protein